MSDMAGPNEPREGFVSVPVRARDEIGELAYYLEQVRRNLLEVNAHVTGSSQTMPAVLHHLRDIVQMTEKATLQVLEQTEALLEESQAVLGLIAGACRVAQGDGAATIGSALGAMQALVQKSNDRAMAIMSALEFQDLTSQKIQRAFEVLEEVSTRLQKIHGLVTPGQEGQAAPAPAPIPAAGPAEAESKSGQDLADELLMQLRG
jgi:chemotaxis regulatin CheY-phosphate phosphatase CheZ